MNSGVSETKPNQTIQCECGLEAALGEDDCGARRDAVLARDFQQPLLYWALHRLAVDAYCLQHSAYVASAKSLAAHLCGMCVALEHGSDPDKLHRLQRWLSTNPGIVKPALPVFRGGVTIGRLHEVEDPQEYRKDVEIWAHSTWEAYRELQPLAREWLSLSARH